MRIANKRATSMKFVLANPQRFGTHPAIKFADANVGGGDGFTTLPLYALGLMSLRVPVPQVEPVTISL